ncbi:GumC family protein [Endozoicomonadaceae bacterium StTr2]
MSNDVLRNLFRLLNIAWRRRYLICIPMVVLPFVGLLGSFFAPKFYEAHTTILLQDNAQLNPLLEDLQVPTNLEDRQAGLKILLKSRNVLSAVATELGYITAETSRIEADKEIARISRSLSIVFGGELIKIYYRSENQEDIAQILETATRHFLEIALAPQKSSLKTSEAFLKTQLESQRVELQQAEQKLADYKSQYAMELPQLHLANVNRLAAMREQLAEKQTELSGARAALDEFNENLAQTNPIIGKLEERIVSIRANLSVLRSRYTDQHSKVQAALRELGRLENERTRLISESQDMTSEDIKRLWQLASTAPSVQTIEGGSQTTILASQLQAVQEANAKVTQLENEVASLIKQESDLGEKIESFAEIERTQAELMRDHKIKQMLYNDFLERYERARVTGALGRYEESDRVKIIDPPFTPTNPTSIPTAIFILAGFFAGLGLGTGMSAILELSDTSLRLCETIENLAGVPVLTRIPVINNANPIIYDMQQEIFLEAPS